VIEVDSENGRTTWWTFAGLFANSQLASAFTAFESRADNLSVTMNQAILPRDLQKQLDANVTGASLARSEQADQVKFHECLPEQLFSDMRVSRLSDPRGVDSSETAKRIFRHARRRSGWDSP